MRVLFGAVYWILVGALAIAGVFALGKLPPYFLLAALAMAVIGAWYPGFRYSWAALIGFGFLPALFLSSSFIGQIVEADWSCSSITFGDSAGEYSYGKDYGNGVVEEVTCSEIPGQLIVVSAISWVAPLFVLAALLYLLKRARRSDEDRGDLSGTIGGETVGDPTGIFVRVAAILVGIANMLVVDPRGVLASSEGRSLLTFFGAFLLATVAGLAASEIVLRVGRTALNGGFFARYGIAVLGLCLGGAILGGLSISLDLATNLPVGPGGGVANVAYAALAYGTIAALVGGILGALEGLVLAFPLAAILGAFRRPPQVRERGASPVGIALTLCLLVIAALISYAASSAPPPAPPPEAASASPSDNPPIPCPEYLGEEVGSFHGPGDQTTPEFETTGDGWGYEFASSGPGTVRIGVLDGNGNEVESTEESVPSGEESRFGESGGGTEFAFTGAFSLELDADEGVDYEVVVCD